MAKFLDENGVSVLWSKIKAKISSEVSSIIDGAPETLDTLNEIANWIANDETGTSALINRVENIEGSIEAKQDQLSNGEGIVITDAKEITYDPEIIATNEYVDANITDTMNFIIQERDNEHAGRVAGDNLKVDKEISGSNGKAQIFNESDGGGAHFIHNDGSESYIGVNDGGLDGLMAQIYADEFVNGSWVGSRINVYNDKIYYTNRDAVASGISKNDEDYEIVVKKDLESALADVEALTEEEILAICV